MLLVFALCGCGGVVEPSSSDASTLDASDASTLDASDASDARELSIDCTDSCAVRAAKARSEGFCEPLLLGGDAGFVACATACADEAARSSVAEQLRLAACIETDPLCFQTLSQCMGR